jgi:DNA-binding NarL/FixJ family response regulator
MHEEPHYAERALSAGARGYVIKRETAKKIIEAIRQVLEGKLFLSETVSGAILEKLAVGKKLDSTSAVKTLSDRELQVFELIGEAQSTRQVAQTLGLSLKTVQTYCARIKQKFNLQSAAELLREAVRFHDACDK